MVKRATTLVISHVSLAFRRVAIIFAVPALVLAQSVPVFAQSATELRNRTEQLQAEIDANEIRVGDMRNQADTLQTKLTQLQLEIDQANKEIELTTLKIQELTIKLDEATNELERQKTLLKTSVRELYKGRGASTLELLVGSDSFSQYFNEQTYLEKLKTGITESAKQVQELKKQIADQKLEQEALLAQQEVQKTVLADKQAEQQQILAATQGEQSKYEQIVAGKREELAQAERDLRDLLDRLARESAGGFLVSYGYVLAGDRVGSIGSTGFSTGPHMHFAVYEGGNYINPRAGGNTLIRNFVWPVPTRGWGDVSQEYGCGAPYSWYLTRCGDGTSLHSGMDISAWYGEPVVASADGNIVYRDWLGGYGFTVIVDHGGGLLTYYPHMLQE